MSTITNELVELEDLDLDVASIEAETTVPDVEAQAQYPR